MSAADCRGLMRERVSVNFNRSDLAELVNILRVRAESWRATAEHLEAGYSNVDSFVLEQCENSAEATRTGEHFENVAATIETQIAQQGGW